MTAEQWEKYGSETFTGFDTDETMCRLSCMNLMLHSVINPQLNKQDSVSKDYQVKDAYDLILANQKLQCGNIKNLLERRSLSWK